MSNLKQLAITGANGYLGKHTITSAIQQGWQVNAIVRREEVIKELEILGAKSFVVKEFDIEGLKEAFLDCKAVLHLANVVCGSKELFRKINIKGLHKVIQAAKDSGVSRLIYPSGLGVDKYGMEDWATNEYFRSKMEAEKKLMNCDIPYIIFRPSYILGPNDELIPDLIDQIFDGIVLIVGDGNTPMQPIFVEDATKAFLAAADGRGKNNTIYELVGPKITNMNSLVELIIENIKNAGVNIPKPDILYVSYEEAPEKLNICKEMVDVMRCDLTPNGYKTAKVFSYILSPLDTAIKAVINKRLFPLSLDRNKRAIILLSGGIDSATALYWALNKGYDCIALSINYNWRPEQEKKAVSNLAKNSNIKLVEINTSYIAQATDLLSEGYPAPVAINAPEGYIPQRNLMYYSIAAFFAEIYGCKWIIGGHILEDTLLFPDTEPFFFKSLEKLINNSKHSHDETEIKIFLPLAKLKKTDVLKLAKKLKVPLEFTWSCYNDFEKPCGRCQSCIKREKALKELKNSAFSN